MRDLCAAVAKTRGDVAVEKATLNDAQKAVVLGMAAGNMCLSEAGRKSNYSRNSVVYYVEQIKEKTGLDPKSFYDLCELVRIAKEGE